MERVLLSVSILEFVSCKISGGSGNDFDGMLMRCLGNKSQPGEVFFLFALGPPSPQCHSFVHDRLFGFRLWNADA